MEFPGVGGSSVPQYALRSTAVRMCKEWLGYRGYVQYRLPRQLPGPPGDTYQIVYYYRRYGWCVTTYLGTGSATILDGFVGPLKLNKQYFQFSLIMRSVQVQL